MPEQKQEHPKHLWDQFIKLGEMIGDGLHNEPGGRWISRDYKRLSKILVPEDKEMAAARRKIKSDFIDAQMKKLLDGRKCECGGEIKQKKSGVKVAYCTSCNTRYVARKPKKEKIIKL